MYHQALVASAIRKLLIKAAAGDANADPEHPPRGIALNRIGAGIGAGTLGIGTGGLTSLALTNYLNRIPGRAERALQATVDDLVNTREAVNRIMRIAELSKNRGQRVKQIQDLLREAKSNPQLAESLRFISPSTLKSLMNIESGDRFRQKVHNEWLKQRNLIEDQLRNRFGYRFATKVLPRISRPLGLLAGIPVGLGTGGLAWHLATRNVPPSRSQSAQ